MTTILAGSYERFLFGFEVGGPEDKVRERRESKKTPPPPPLACGGPAPARSLST